MRVYGSIALTWRVYLRLYPDQNRSKRLVCKRVKIRSVGGKERNDESWARLGCHWYRQNCLMSTGWADELEGKANVPLLTRFEAQGEMRRDETENPRRSSPDLALLRPFFLSLVLSLALVCPILISWDSRSFNLVERGNSKRVDHSESPIRYLECRYQRGPCCSCGFSIQPLPRL